MASFKSKASNSEGGQFELPPAGAHPAVLIGLVDLGTHRREYNGKASENRKLFFVWELTAENDSKGQTFVVGQDYTWSLNKKANLRPVVEGYLGRALKEDEEFDFGVLINQPCQVTLTENTTSGGKKFVEVSGVCKPMRGLTVPDATRGEFALSLDEFDSCVNDPELPPWLPRLYGREVLEEIKASKEWQSLPAF